MKRVLSVLLFLLVIFLLFACQSPAVTSEAATSLEPSSSKTTTSPESSVGEPAKLSYDHTRFKTTQELLDYLKQNSTEKEINGIEIQNFIKDNQITIYEPTFTPPDGFHLSSVEIWTVYGSYHYATDDLIDYLDMIRSSALAAVESISHPQSSYETKVESLITSEKNVSSEDSSISDTIDDSTYRAKNMIILQWCTEKSETPGAAFAWSIKNFGLVPLDNVENHTYYYSTNGVIYSIYWETDGYLCFASVPAVLFSEENVAKICSFKPVTVPLD